MSRLKTRGPHRDEFAQRGRATTRADTAANTSPARHLHKHGHSAQFDMHGERNHYAPSDDACSALVVLGGVGSAPGPGHAAPARPQDDSTRAPLRRSPTRDDARPEDHGRTSVRRTARGRERVLQRVLRSPEMGAIAQQLMRRCASTHDPSSTSRHHHHRATDLAEARAICAALARGPSPAIADAIAWQAPDRDAERRRSQYTFCTELFHTKQVSDSTFKMAGRVRRERVRRSTGDELASDGVDAVNTDRYPLPDGVQPNRNPEPTTQGDGR